MSDETPAPGVTQDTPNDVPAEPEVDWRKRYEDLQPEFTRSRQTLTDREALLAHVQENFPDLIAEDEPEPEPEPEFDEDDEIPLTRAEFEQWKRDQFDGWRGEVDTERGTTRFETDLKDLLNGRELTDRGREVISALTTTGGNNRKALEQAVERWFEISPVSEESEEETPKKKVPHVVPGGTPATQAKDFKDMSRDEIDEWMASRVRELNTQT